MVLLPPTASADAEVVHCPVFLSAGPAELFFGLRRLRREGAKVMFQVGGQRRRGQPPWRGGREAGEALGWDVTVVHGQFDPSVY